MRSTVQLCIWRQLARREAISTSRRHARLPQIVGSMIFFRTICFVNLIKIIGMKIDET